MLVITARDARQRLHARPRWPSQVVDTGHGSSVWQYVDKPRAWQGMRYHSDQGRHLCRDRMLPLLHLPSLPALATARCEGTFTMLSAECECISMTSIVHRAVSGILVIINARIIKMAFVLISCIGQPHHLLRLHYHSLCVHCDGHPR